ncbi:MAG: hypothetical protein EOM67_16445 [Spirochaetia bacterium]|nr:hypothetical protein [Spirochaetia bacterium]
MKKQKTKLPEGWDNSTLRYKIDDLLKELSFIPHYSWEMRGMKNAFSIYSDDAEELVDYYNQIQRMRQSLIDTVCELYNLKEEDE